MSNEWIKIDIPTTMSNISAGLNSFGLALKKSFDTIEGRIIKSGVSIHSASDTEYKQVNNYSSIGIAIMEVLNRCKANFGIEIKVNKCIESNIDSYGISAGGAYLANILCGGLLTPSEVILCATHAEDVVSGGFHADNIAPCILGGFTIIRSYEPFEVISIKPPDNLGVIVTIPNITISVEEYRRFLPREISIKDLTFHIGNAACLVYAMMVGDLGLIGRSIKDAVFEPSISHLIPHLKQAEDEAMSHGALASFLSGPSPYVVSFYDSGLYNGNDIATSIKDLYSENDIECDTWITGCGTGCKRI